MIIAFSGTPGTGKHTVAKIVSKIIGYKVIDLGKILKNGKKEREISLSQLNSAFRSVIKDNSIVVSHMSHLINSSKINLVIVFRTQPLILAKRLKKRGYSKSKIYDNVMFEAIDGTYLEAIETKKKVFQVNNSKNVKETVDKVIKIINGTGKNENIDFSSSIIKIEKIFK